MPYSPTVSSGSVRKAESRPRLITFDSYQECSLDHWLEVYTLVEKADIDLDGCILAEESESYLLTAQ